MVDQRRYQRAHSPCNSRRDSASSTMPRRQLPFRCAACAHSRTAALPQAPASAASAPGSLAGAPAAREASRSGSSASGRQRAAAANQQLQSGLVHRVRRSLPPRVRRAAGLLHLLLGSLRLLPRALGVLPCCRLSSFRARASSSTSGRSATACWDGACSGSSWLKGTRPMGRRRLLRTCRAVR